MKTFMFEGLEFRLADESNSVHVGDFQRDLMIEDCLRRITVQVQAGEHELHTWSNTGDTLIILSGCRTKSTGTIDLHIFDCKVRRYQWFSQDLTSKKSYVVCKTGE